MKKLYFLFVALIVSSISFGQDLVITGVIDGPLPGGTPKGLELYVINNIADLSIYGIESSTNGAPAVAQEFTFPAVAATAGQFIYIASEAPNFTQYLGFAPDYVDGVIGVNGDDPVILYMNGGIVDILGTFVDGTGQPWEYLDGWAYRVDGQGPTATFSGAEWTFSGPNALDGCDLGDDTGTNAGCGSVFPVGTYSPTANNTPTINVGGAVTGLDYFEGNGPSAEDSFNVSALNLGDNLVVTAPTNFEVATDALGPYGASVSYTPDGSGTVATTQVYVRLQAGLLSGPYAGDATATATGATTQTVSLSGTVSPPDPQISITGGVGSLDYSFGAGPSPEDSFNVSALFLQADLTVTAPASFEVATDALGPYGPSVAFTPDGNGEVISSPVFVRLAAGLAIGPYSGDVTASSTNAPDQTLAVSGNVFGPPTNALILTAAFDGPLGGGTPKGVEIYVVQDIPDLSLFGIGSANNGGGTDGQEYTFSGSAIAGSFIYVASETIEFTNFFGFAPDFDAGSTMGINGDDAIELFENGQVIDTFGDINMDGTGMPWDYLDGWAYRSNNTGPDGGTFVIGNWSFSGIDALDGETSNGTAVTPVPVGTFSTTLSVNTFDTTNFTLYPNPNNIGQLYIASSNNAAMAIQIFDVLGKEVITETVQNGSLDISSLNSGLYIVKLSQGNASTTKKLVVE
ncbi:MAG: T9SS type A sorting domain-containing protein [Flavobacteriaceae bacterium]|nr:MAG: T9SS type A sorting domain-containing protein [Flavobacteriaceae bacterium]